MILNDTALRAWAATGGLTPYDPDNINPASIDLCWSGRLRVAHPEGWSDVVEYESYVLQVGGLYLMDTLEVINMPDDAAGLLALKSSMGRIGLEHLHAGFVDPGFHNATLTLEIKVLAPWPITLKKGQRIVQMVLYRLNAKPEKTYAVTGRYNHQKEPQAAK